METPDSEPIATIDDLMPTRVPEHSAQPPLRRRRPYRKVIFLDRDGILIEERGDYTWKIDDANLVDGVVEALTKLRDAGFEFIVITNQSGISKGLYKHRDVKALHGYLAQAFAQFGIHFLDWYYCPHSNMVGLCTCRKPAGGMVERAAARFAVDLSASHMIGDMPRDAECGESAGVKSWRVLSNSDLNELVPRVLAWQATLPQ